MLAFKKNLLELEGSIPKELIERLEARKRRAHDGDNKIRQDALTKEKPIMTVA